MYSFNCLAFPIVFGLPPKIKESALEMVLFPDPFGPSMKFKVGENEIVVFLNVWKFTRVKEIILPSL
ncbi:hypothetical protein NBO_795g0001 [Nosema bombycis CQ1]|uniref:Uncharacterized protein n=1 Tax=Nosema bombycis (strain CQ1 / CVCC 102059) TaxID=578461 RepID=R0MCP8_NOSB1|nr:hypothetical protein NBO_795g0001 [Nosema bombycis CQ1]|eukprot:EOB11810.1 hypothetical protein NBO_795g0001 [Nosema bombycis CQ1]